MNVLNEDMRTEESTSAQVPPDVEPLAERERRLLTSGVPLSRVVLSGWLEKEGSLDVYCFRFSG